MKRTLNFTLMLAAGLLGGLLSRYLAPTPVFAQASAPKEVRAQSFILVNQQGAALGRIAVDSHGEPYITLVNNEGRTIWSTQASLLLQSSK